MAELSPGSEFAGHRIEEVAGRGGMGVVYRATHIALEREVGLKIIAPELAADASFQERFKRESRLAASIDHPNVIPIHHAGEEGGTLYITMRFVPGTDLREMIAAQGALDPAVAADIIGQIGGALDSAHAKGLIHRDVKPANILIEDHGGRTHAFLTDFGLTRQAAGSTGGLTKTGHWVGTLDYVAPEQIEGKKVDARADVYALGCVFYQSLTGEIPYPKDTDVAKMWAHLNDDPPLLGEKSPHLTGKLDEVVSKAMAKKPKERYMSAGDFGDAAKAAVAGEALDRPERSVAVGAAAAGAPPDAPTAPAAAGAGPGGPGAPTVGAGTAPASPAEPSAGGGGGPSRKTLAWVGGGLAAIAIAAIAVLALGGGGGGGGGDTSETETEVDTAPAEALIQNFKTAFGAENIGILTGEVLSEDAGYFYGGDDREAAAAEYQEIFSTLDVTGYQLEVEEIDADAGGKYDVEATYRYQSLPKNPQKERPIPYSGSVRYRLEEGDGGDLVITEVHATPDFAGSWRVTDPPETTQSEAKLNGEVVGADTTTFNAVGTKFIIIQIDPGQRDLVRAGTDLNVTTEWQGATGEGGTEDFKIPTPYAS